MRKIGETELSKVAGAGDIINSGNIVQDNSVHFKLKAGRDLAAFGSVLDTATFIQKVTRSFNG